MSTRSVCIARIPSFARPIALVGLALAAFGPAGCLPDLDRGELEQLSLAISNVPDDVACVRVKAVGSGRTVQRELEAEPGMPLQKSFGGLPLGTVLMSAEAFVATCDAVTTSSIAQWVSEEEPVSIVLGRLSSLTLTLHRNGRLKVGVDFADEPICSPVAAACLSSAECCSRTCDRGVCRASQDAGVQAAPDAQ
jgi:hypothetical protein